MKPSFKRTLAITAAAVGLTAVLPMSTASAINTTDCGSRTDLVKITNFEGTHFNTFCFANAGVVDIRIDWVLDIESGNNNIRFQMGDGSVHTLDKWGVASFNQERLSRLRIF